MYRAVKRKRVIIVFPTSRIAHVEKMSGIFRFLREAGNWELEMKWPSVTREDLEAADGIIMTGDVSAETVAAVADSSLPAAFIAVQCKNRKTNIALVETNGYEIGARTAECLLRTGRYSEFIYLHPTHTTFFTEQCERAFRKIVEKNGFSCQTFCGKIPDIQDIGRHVAVFAANDYLAASVLSKCRTEGLSVPNDIAVVGFSNDEVFCENYDPPISSVEPDFEQQGYLAAKALARMMSARKPLARIVHSVGVRHIVHRASTPPPSAGDALVRRAMEYIRRHATEPIAVQDVVRHLKVSRRLAELRFKELRGDTILGSIMSHRLQATKAALRTSSESIASICRRCGWKSENHPKKLFQRTFGMSMRDWRKVQQA